MRPGACTNPGPTPCQQVVVLISILGFGAATKPLLAYLMGAEEPTGTQEQHGGCSACPGRLCA